MKKLCVVFAVLFAFASVALIPAQAMAAVYTSVGSGVWSAAGTWSPVGQPTASDTVIIRAEHTVMVNSAGAEAKGVIVDGTLVVASSGILYVDSSITLRTDGNLAIGAEYNDYPGAPGLIVGYIEGEGYLDFNHTNAIVHTFPNIITGHVAVTNLNGNTRLSGRNDSDGYITVEGGELILRGDYSDYTGSINVYNGAELVIDSNKTLTIDGDVWVEAGGLVTNESSIELLTRSTVFNEGRIDNYSTVDLHGEIKNSGRIYNYAADNEFYVYPAGDITGYGNVYSDTRMGTFTQYKSLQASGDVGGCNIGAGAFAFVAAALLFLRRK